MTHYRIPSFALVALVALLAAAGCGKARSTSPDARSSATFTGGAADGTDVTVQDARWCVTCHGDAARLGETNAAPGYAFAPMTGAHAAHLTAYVQCGNCHVVPATADAHTRGVDLKYVATTRHPDGAPIAAFNGTTCAATYCHGNWANGNGAAAVTTTVTWTSTTAMTCTSCHADPPDTAGHSGLDSSTDCGNCHPDFSGHTVTDAALHVNGDVDGGCTGCHGTSSRTPGGTAGTYDANLAASPPVDHTGADSSLLVGAHLAHVNPNDASPYKPLLCSECHPSASAVTHRNGSPDVTLAGSPGANLDGFPPSETPSTGVTAATCSTYCHDSPSLTGGSVATWSWGGTGATCGSCHGAPPPAPHSASTNCGGCHAGYTVSTVDRATHIDGTVQSTGCTGCHGTDGRVNGGMPGVTYDADLAASPPVDHTGADSSLLVGAHLAHVNPNDASPYKPLLCSECHPSASAVTHRNGSPDVTLAGSPGANLDGFPPSETPSTGVTAATCSTYCHSANSLSGGSISTWSWTGTDATCGSCHGDPPTFISDGTTAHTSSTACDGCHPGYTSSSVARATHIDGTIQVTLSCTSCHGDANRANGIMPVGFDGFDANQQSAPPVDTARSSTGILVGAHVAHVNPSTTTAVYRPIACTECHPDNTAGGHPGGGLQLTFANATGAGLAGFLTARTSSSGGTAATCNTYCHNGPSAAGYGGTAAAWSWSGSAATCASCHADPPATAGHVGLTAASDCGGCHPGYTATTVNLAKHINGTLDGGGEPTAATTACGGCHLTLVTAMNGATFSHGLGSASSTDTGFDWSAAGLAFLSDAPAADRSCVSMCHGDHPHSLSTGGTHEYDVYVDPLTQILRDAQAATRTTSNRAKTDFDPTANTGLCSDCHAKPIANGGVAFDATAFGASAHDFATGWQYQLHDGGLFDRNCTKCHASRTEGTTPLSPAVASGTAAVHFGSDPFLLAGTTTPIAAGLVCFNCHGTTVSAPLDAGLQGDRSGVDIQAVFAKETPSTGSSHTAVGTCLGCHDPHKAKTGDHATPGNLAGPPLEGATGAELTTPPASWATPPAAGDFTSKAIVAGTDVEATLCFKCHSAFDPTLATRSVDQTYTAGTAAFTSTSSTVTGTGTTWTAAHVGWQIKNNTNRTLYRVTGVASPTSLTISPAAVATGSGAYTLILYGQTDVAREFNPNNVGDYAGGTSTDWQAGETAGGFHPVLADAGANLGRIKLANLVNTADFTWSTTTRNKMTCTDCHASDDTTDPMGPHGSAASYILKGPNTLWNNALRVNGTSPNVTTEMPAGTFCRNCHDAGWANSRFAPNDDNHYSRSAHRLPCMNCHAAIPHGGPRPGILIAPAGVGAGVPAHAGWDTGAPYSTPGAGITLGIATYPANADTDWAQENCGCGDPSPH